MFFIYIRLLFPHKINKILSVNVKYTKLVASPAIHYFVYKSNKSDTAHPLWMSALSVSVLHSHDKNCTFVLTKLGCVQTVQIVFTKNKYDLIITNLNTVKNEI